MYARVASIYDSHVGYRHTLCIVVSLKDEKKIFDYVLILNFVHIA